ncbi:unnamed protein product [Trifolium pratense]|uniref:Uncharacterized protein n=1 Tax=Trifolium pratense TaxID=57577 RepID=A0ACB0IKE7_TRIPR|nr:unnamed protein product [Trifolium pratense]
MAYVKHALVVVFLATFGVYYFNSFSYHLITYVNLTKTASRREVGAFALIILILNSNMAGVLPLTLKQNATSRFSLTLQ